MEPEDETLDQVNYHIDQQIKIRAHYEKKGFSTFLKSQVFEDILKKDEMFEDNLFPPNNGSIYNYHNHANLMRKKAQAYKAKLEVSIIFF